MKEKMTKEKVLDLSKQLMFHLTDDEAENVAHEFDTLFQQLSYLEKLDTDGVEPMVYPFEEETTFMRDDQHVEELSQEDALSNTKRTHKGYVVLPRVVK